MTLTVTGTSREDNVYELKIRGRGGRRVPASLVANSAEYGLFLVAPSGKRYRGDYRENSWRDNGQQVVFALRFKVREVKAGWLLVWVYPKKTIEKEFPFKLRNVPVP